MNNETIILHNLKKGKRLSQYPITTKGLSMRIGLRKYTTRTTRLSSYIHILRAKGWVIEKEWKTNGDTRWAEYYLPQQGHWKKNVLMIEELTKTIESMEDK